MIGADLTIQLVVMRLIAGIIIATVQGATIAAAAVLLGDKGPRYDGRLTLLPTSHVDLLGLGLMALAGVGWSQPVAVETAQLRGGRWGLVAVALAGTLVLLLLAWLMLLLTVPILTSIPDTAGITLAAFLRVAARLSVWVAIFTLLPLPPLAGAHLLAAVGIRLPPVAGTVIMWVLAIASLFGVTRLVLTPVYDLVAPLVLGADMFSQSSGLTP